MATVKRKVLFVTSSMQLGGAERQLMLLCKSLESMVDVEIISLDSNGPMVAKYLDWFPKIIFVNSSKRNIFSRVIVLRSQIRKLGPDIVVTWLYEADLIAGVATRTIGKIPIIWSARNSDYPNSTSTKRFLLRFFSALLPSVIVANGKPAFDFHKTLGYPVKKMRVIPNIVADWTAKKQSHSNLINGNNEINSIKLGIAARQVSGKGILETIRAVSEINESNKLNIILSIVGQTTKESQMWLTDEKYAEMTVRPILSDEEIAAWFSDLDLYVMASTAWESQPNSLIEAIAIGCPVLVSNRVELPEELGNLNRYDPLEPEGLFLGVMEILNTPRHVLIDQAIENSENIKNIYSRETVISLWRQQFQVMYR